MEATPRPADVQVQRVREAEPSSPRGSRASTRKLLTALTFDFQGFESCTMTILNEPRPHPVEEGIARNYTFSSPSKLCFDNSYIISDLCGVEENSDLEIVVKTHFYFLDQKNTGVNLI